MSESKTCQQCNGSYEAKRSDSLYCSVGCRVTAKRNKDLQSVTANDVTANKEAIRVTDSVTAIPKPAPIDVRPVDCLSTHLPDAVPGVHVPLAQPIHLTNCQARGVNDCNMGDHMSASEIAECKGNIVNRVSLPGDADYHGVCKVTA